MLACASLLIYVNMTSHVLIQMLQNVRADYLWESTINNSLTLRWPVVMVCAILELDLRKKKSGILELLGICLARKIIQSHL